MPILQIALDTPLDKVFDYLPGAEQPPPGTRVFVPFGKGNQNRVGWVIQHVEHSAVPAAKLKHITDILEPEPLLDGTLFPLILWAAQYYHYPLGQVIATAMPTLLNQGVAAELPAVPAWRKLDDAELKRAPVQQAVMAFLDKYPAGVTQSLLLTHIPTGRRALKELERKGLIEGFEWRENTSLPQGEGLLNLPSPLSEGEGLKLNPAQQAAVDALELKKFHAYLLHGVTGSGKTEVYLQIIQRALEQGLQALVLVPEINLTPQMLARFEVRFRQPIALLHSHLTDRERLYAWLRARNGSAAIVIGTRSAVWTPLANPGVIIIDEEHDSSYKQSEHFRYSARDVGIVRARKDNIPIVLGSATPALESLHNALQGRYTYLELPQRAGAAKPPKVRLIDMRNQYVKDNLSNALLHAMHTCLAAKQQVLLFVTRRGYAPALMCHQCGWVADCTHCSAHMTLHLRDKRLHCHHCGATQRQPPACPACQKPELKMLGHGTERIEEHLQSHFPDARILRIDSDSTRRKQAMQEMLARIQAGEADILVGTQMLTKGHHFPNVTLVGVINIDGALFSTDFRAAEHTAQRLIQVAGRAGREELPGLVLLQTRQPEHPLFQQVFAQGYGKYAQTLLAERREAQLPPYSHLALLRGEADAETEVLAYLNALKSYCEQLGLTPLTALGPVLAPLQRKAGRFRGQLLLQSPQREVLHTALHHALYYARANTPRGVTWRLDVDPLDLG